MKVRYEQNAYDCAIDYVWRNNPYNKNRTRDEVQACLDRLLKRVGKTSWVSSGGFMVCFSEEDSYGAEYEADITVDPGLDVDGYNFVTRDI